MARKPTWWTADLPSPYAAGGLLHNISAWIFPLTVLP